MTKKRFPLCLNPEIPDKKRILPGDYIIGKNSESEIRTAAGTNRATLETEEGDYQIDNYYVAMVEDGNGTTTGFFVLKEKRTIDAINKLEKEIGRYYWFFEDSSDVSGVSQIALTCNFVRLVKVRKENALIEEHSYLKIPVNKKSKPVSDQFLISILNKCQ